MDVINTMEMVPIGAIKPYARNARKNDKTVAKLVELLPKVGFNVPLVLDRNNVIVKGHTRWQAAMRLGMKTLPCVYTDADPETVKLDRIADNRVQEFSLWNEDLLGSELAGLNLPFALDLGILDFKIDLPAFEVGFGAPPSGLRKGPEAAARDTGAGEEEGALSGSGEDDTGEGREDEDGEDEPEMTAADLVDVDEPEYLEVRCDKCGNRLYVKK